MYLKLLMVLFSFELEVIQNKSSSIVGEFCELYVVLNGRMTFCMNHLVKQQSIIKCVRLSHFPLKNQHSPSVLTPYLNSSLLVTMILWFCVCRLTKVPCSSFRTGLISIVGFINEKIIGVTRFGFIKVECEISVGRCLWGTQWLLTYSICLILVTWKYCDEVCVALNFSFKFLEWKIASILFKQVLNRQYCFLHSFMEIDSFLIPLNFFIIILY